jgi:hypothetical protein
MQVIPLFRDLCFKKWMCSNLGIEREKREFGVKETIATLVYKSVFQQGLDKVELILQEADKILSPLQQYNCQDIKRI